MHLLLTLWHIDLLTVINFSPCYTHTHKHKMLNCNYFKQTKFCNTKDKAQTELESTHTYKHSMY